MDGKILEILKSMQEQMNSMENKINNRFDNLECKFDNLENRFDNLEKGQEEIKATIGDLEATNAKRHIELEKSINVLNENVDFITHKWNETERDMFNIKNNLKIIK